MAGTANSIITPQTPKSAYKIYGTAQATYPPTTNPTNTTVLMTAGLNGARVTRFYAMPQESTAAACIVQYFRSLDTGTTKFWAGAALGTNDTVSSTDVPIVLDFGFSDSNPMILSGGEQIYVAPSIAKNFIFVIEYADY